MFQKNPVRESCLMFKNRLDDIKINQEAIELFVKKILKEKINFPHWPAKKHYIGENPKKTLIYLFLLDSINFCFWAPPSQKKWSIFYKGKKYTGYFALSLALKKFFDENEKLGNFFYFSKISFNNFLKILQGGKNLLFLKERYRIIKKVSSFFVKKWRQDPQKFISSAKKNISLLLEKIYKNLYSFDDISYYKNKKVYFLKRAQILIADIWGAFEGKGLGDFKNLDYLTAFADYKLPQILHHLKILEYSKKLTKKIKNREVIKKNSSYEIQIRIATIIAVELIKNKLEKYNKKIFSFQIDWLLWNMSQKTKMALPHHLTKTIFY